MLLIGLLGAVVLIALWPRRRAAPVEPSGSREELAAAPAPPPAPPRVAPAAAADPVGEEPPPIVDEVLVEKKEVCAGEDNLVTVKAHTENGTDEFLHYVIDGQKGSSVPVRLMAEGGEVIGEHFIRVFGRKNAVTTLPLPRYVVRDCRPAYLAEIKVALEPNTWSDYDFLVRVIPFPSDGADRRERRPFSPDRVEWAFGDGETAKTDAPRTSHSYEAREQRTRYSYMNVTATVSSQDGDRVVARTSLALENPAFEALAEKGVVQLMISLDPRFPGLDDEGRVVQRVRLFHAAREPVTIDAVAVTKYLDDGGESKPEPVDVRSLLGTTSIPPGKRGVDATVILDTALEPKVFSMTYRLSGRSASGKPVMGSFSVMRPPPAPTPESSKIVTDPLLKAKILAARAMLDKKVVSDREIGRLEAEGKFANLQPAPADAK
jgi:hypothetical protein